MLINITDYCHYNCSHCIHNATTQGKHMSEEVFRDSVSYAIKNNAMVIILSGGEPTTHPLFNKFLDIVKKSGRIISVTSNGWYINQDGTVPHKFDIHGKGNVCLQITYDERYYPNWSNAKYAKKDSNQYILINKISNLSNCTKIDESKVTKRQANCFNLRINAIIGKFKTMKDYIESTGRIMKFCRPVINVDGSISIGESDICARVGTIYDDDDTIMDNIINCHCNNCGFYWTTVKKVSDKLIKGEL